MSEQKSTRRWRTSSPDHIRRVENGNYGGWSVSIMRLTVFMRQTFSDSTYGGKAKALAAAKAWRDEVLRQTSGADYAIWKRELLRDMNTSGVVGVSRSTQTKRGKPVTQWLANWQDLDGKRYGRGFSVNKYGEEGAKALAIKARQEAMADLAKEARRREREAISKAAASPLRDP